MPELGSISGSFLNAVQQAQAGQYGAALQQVTGLVDQTLGEGTTDQFKSLLDEASAVTTLRPEGSGAPNMALPAGPSGQVAALGGSVEQAVNNRLEAVQTTEAEAAENVKTLLSGGEIDLHNVILSAERAQLELQFTMQLRNKLIEAYQEVMRMPI